MHFTRDHDATSGRYRLQPRRDIHTIAVEIFAIYDQVAEVQSDREHDGDIRGLLSVRVSHGLLEFDGSAECVHGAGKLDQSAVTDQLDQAAAVSGQRRFEPLGTVGLQPRKGAILVATHKTRVACDISRQNCRQPPYHPVAGHEASPRLQPAALLSSSPAGLHLRVLVPPMSSPFQTPELTHYFRSNRSCGPNRSSLPFLALL